MHFESISPYMVRQVTIHGKIPAGLEVTASYEVDFFYVGAPPHLDEWAKSNGGIVELSDWNMGVATFADNLTRTEFLLRASEYLAKHENGVISFDNLPLLRSAFRH